MTTPQPYVAINASAGSGKTYTLVQRVLMICLAQPYRHDAISHILALTFTNKAANEMKERILKWLKAFTKNNYADNQDLANIRTALAKQHIHVTMEELHNRSQKVLDYILHHYSTLNIGTIDKFNARLVRSFSYELGLAHQFNLEIQSEPFLIEAVDKMLDEVGADVQISDAFMDFVNYNLDNDERVSINKTLYRKAKQFVNDIHYDELKSNSDFNWQAYEAAKNELRSEISALKKASDALAESSRKLMENRQLENADFHGGGNKCIKYFFDNYVQNGEPKLHETAEAEAAKVHYYRNGASKSGKAKEHLISEILEALISNREEIIKNHIEIQKKSKILRELLPLKINKEIQDQLNIIEQENDLVLLSKFNILINENLKNEPSAFIYEKIGTQYQHFFLDEFQDTSRMQWENILPLRDHTINSENHSFTLVGDPKQSIYRFRGGDSELMLNILNKKEKVQTEVKVEVLENNWRSAENIVTFNNELYAYLASGLAEHHQNLFAKDGLQKPKKSVRGRVKVSLTDYSKSADLFYENVAEQMHRNIQECVDNGFRLKDITILCRDTKSIQRFSQLLGTRKIHCGGKDIYIKSISEKGLTLGLSETLQAVVEFLRWQVQPANKQYLVKMMYFLRQLGRISITDFTSAMLEILQLETKAETERFIEVKYGLKLRRDNFPNLNLYNFIEYYIHEFSVEHKETDYLLNFLENLYSFTQNAGLTVKDFIQYWDEEASTAAIQTNDNIDAIKMMTIHAAKGLEFPVVFLPMRNSHKDADFSEWLAVEGFNALKSVNIKAFTKELGTYDTEIQDFNEENIYKNKIDRFCLQYVATTRPVEQLFLYLERPSKSNNYLEIYDFIKEHKKPQDLDELDLYPETGGSFRKQSTTKQEQRQALSIDRLSHGHENIRNIKIATPSKNYQTTVESVRTGIFTHEVLSKINTAKDVELVLESYLIAGAITADEKSAIADKIYAIVQHDEFEKYFATGLKVINEKDIMISEDNGTALYRPDRLIETSEGYYIIDFKTGAEKDEHRNQLQQYRRVLEQLGKNVLETKIIYI